MKEIQESNGSQEMVFKASFHEEGRVDLFIDGSGDMVGSIKVNEFRNAPRHELLDRALHSWIRHGDLLSVIKDPQHLAALELSRTERAAGVPWYRLTHRFLMVPGSSWEDPRFRFTTDKSDLGERTRRILLVGEEAVLREEREKAEADAREQEARRVELERLRREHAATLTTVTRAALKGEPVPTDLVKDMQTAGLLEHTTTFRSCVRYPGEHWIFRYDFQEDGVRHSGFLGFGQDLSLVSVDARLPEPSGQ
ncbi:MAG: hypothetical protein WC551_05225 [Patescibacteria group bacterium]